MTDRPVEDTGMPAEVNRGKADSRPSSRSGAGIVFLPASSRRSVGEYFTGKAEKEEVELPDPAL